MDFRLLGPLEVIDGSRPLSIGAGRQRALLALLLLRANEPVTSDRLVEELWGEEPPATAHKMLHNQVSALRRALGQNGRLETQGSAYRLEVGPGELDVASFEELAARGRTELGEDPEAAAETLREALGLWRGPALSDFAYEAFAQGDIARLEEERWAAFGARVEADLALGRHAALVGELEAAVADQPLREQLRGQLMLALYRCGRQAEALEAYRRARTTLVDEVGVEPGAELRRLHEAILAQDPALDLAPRGLPPALEGGSPLLVGRDEELARLSERLAEARAGRGGIALVQGPHGIGKTRLAAELARVALAEGMVVLYLGADAPPDLLDDAGPTLAVIDEPSPDHLRRMTAPAGGRRLLLLVLLAEPAELAADTVIELGPLGPEAVGEIASLYLPAGDQAGLAAGSGGVPAAVHRLAAARARERAAAALDASAGRTAAERRDLRAAETDLAGDVLALRAADQREHRLGAPAGGAPERAVCPFMGLTPFDAAHAEYFFGRERLVAELVARLVGSPLLAVIGPSGSGKSSAVRAGLLPALAEGALPGSERRHQALMRPGAHPLAELERALPADDDHAFLVVDQFEEVFTVCRDKAERTAFLNALVGLTEDGDGRVQVVLAMRADFYGRCAAHEGLTRLVGANQVLVGPMSGDELRRAIEEPARRVGLRVEPSMADALIADVLDEPGGLPLLSAALLEQWREREGRTLRHATYERTGGVQGAVGRLAEHTYSRLSEPERLAARRILLRLADAGDQEAEFVRRRMPLDELDPERDEHTAAALEALVHSRLVTADEDTLEVAHEALLREWPRLRGWLEEDAEGRRLHQHLIGAARDWQAAGRDRGELYRGARLAATLDWSAGHEGDLNELERDFVDESRAAAERDAERQRRANRRLRTLLAGLGALLAIAIVAGVVALNQRGEAREAAVTADAQRLGVEALGTDRLDEAVLLTRAAVELDESPATRGTLLSALLRAPAAVGVVNHGWPMDAVAISPDGRLMATGDERGAVTVYDAATRRPLGPPHRIQGYIQNVRFSPDGGTLAISAEDPKNLRRNGVVDLIDVRTLERTLRVRVPPLGEPAAWVATDVVFPPNGPDILVRQFPGDSPGAPASPVYRVDGKTGAVTDRLLVGRFPSSRDASATADGERFLLTSQRENLTWEIESEALRVVRSWPVGDSAGAVSPDGAVFALGSQAGRVRLLDLGSGQTRPLRGRHEGAVDQLRFTPDGRTLVTSSEAGELFAWDVERGSIAQRFAGHTGDIGGLDLTSDGRTLITASDDTRAILWDLAGDRRLDRRFTVRRRFPVEDTPRGIAISPDGRTLALTHSDGAVDLIDTRTLKRRASVRAIDGMALSGDFSPDGRLLAVTGEGGQVTLWNTRTLAPAGELRGMRGPSQAVAFSPDGELLAAAEGFDEGPPQPLQVWDVRRRKLTAFRGRTSASLIAFSADGEWIAAAAGERGTDVRDARTGRLVKRFEVGDLSGVGDFSRSVAFSPDGELLFIGQFDGTGRLFSTETWKQVGRPLQPHTGRITFPEFTPDGRTLITASADGTVALSDVETQKPIGAPLELEPNAFASAALSPDGARLYAISTKTDGLSFNMSPEAWKRHACLVAGRGLTPDEWDEALPGRRYQRVCTGD